MNFKDNRDKAREAGAKSKPGKHAKTRQWEALGELISNELTDEVIAYLKKQKGEELFKSYLMLLEYFKPKLSRAEIRADVKTEITDAISKAFDWTDETDQQEP